MKYRKGMCLALAVLAALMLSGCSLGQELLLDGNDVLSGGEAVQLAPPDTDDPLQAEVVPDPDPPVQDKEEAEPAVEEQLEEAPSETPFETAVPVPTAEPTPEPTAEPTPKPTVTPRPTATPAPAVRPGTYAGEDGSVLTVKENGDCTYKTAVTMVVGGEEVTETVTFRGAVSDEGDIHFTKVTYHGMDITSFAAQAGYEDTATWEAAAAALYEK